MQIVKTGLFCVGIALAAGNAVAQDMKKAPMPNDSPKPMTMQECKDQMAMARTDAMKTDPAVMKKDAACADMMKKDGGMNAPAPNAPMKGDTKK
jgi:hypothetical protein